MTGSKPVSVVIPVRSHLLAGLHARRFAWHLRSADPLLAVLTCDYAARVGLPCDKLSGENSPVFADPDSRPPLGHRSPNSE
jgi:hypothetical protein